MYAQLHTRSWYSFLAGGSSPHALAQRAANVGIDALAITDRNGVQGAVQFQQACEREGIKPLFGADVQVEEDSLILLAGSRTGYRNLCSLLTRGRKRDRETPRVNLEEVEAVTEDLFCLTGTSGSKLWDLINQERTADARQWIRTLRELFADHLSIEITNRLLPGDKKRMRRLAQLSDETGVPLAATADVRYAIRQHYQRYDLLTCIRLGETVFNSHPARPQNGEAYLRGEAALRRMIPYPEAFDRTSEIARACTVDLLPGEITTPDARIKENVSSHKRLRSLCEKALDEKYPGENYRDARSQMNDELYTIGDKGLDDFFLVVREVVEAAHERDIRCAGRGSAANSIVAYLLDITGVDPIEHDLLFERFLHRGRKGTPDIDIDFDSDRRDEIIDWIENRFGPEHTAMTATVITYKLRSALRDVGKALGWTLEQIDELTASVPRRSAGRAPDYREVINRRLDGSPLVDTLIRMTSSLEGCPRHLGLHSGGMVLSKEPLSKCTPVRRSANGVRMISFDKDDVEALGLVKLDVLGLRMLSTLSEAEEMVERHHQKPLDLDHLPLDDERTFRLIRSGNPIGLFQIESQGQHHLLAQHKPERFEDLIAQVALFRPGPLQGEMVHPFVRRRRGEEPVKYDHPSLKPVLEDTYGIILFQEQVLEVAHRFAGMSLEEADDFRDLISDFRDPEEMESMRSAFVDGAVENGVAEETAHDVFDQVSKFVGYGFCRSHAAAFAKTVYQSAYLKAHYPAAFMAAVMQQRPGMYSQMTLEQEAKKFGVEIRPPEINRSSTRFDLEPTDDGWAIRKPLTSVQNVSSDDARDIVWERLDSPFESVEGLYRRVALDIGALKSLARSGALDAVSRDGRTALWEIGVLHQRIGSPGRSEQRSLFTEPIVTEKDVPELPSLSEEERLSWDLETHRAARRHPMTLYRRQLMDLEIRPIETCYAFGRDVPIQKGGTPPILTVAGISILRQAPSTANGTMFLTLEDETGYIQCVCFPQVRSTYEHVLTGESAIVRGQLQVESNWRGLIVQEAWPLDDAFGGYKGHPSASGGRDRWIRSTEKKEVG